MTRLVKFMGNSRRRQTRSVGRMSRRCSNAMVNDRVGEGLFSFPLSGGVAVGRGGLGPVVSDSLSSEGTP